MSTQTSFSATICVLTMALFALTALAGGFQAQAPRAEMPQLVFATSILAD